MKPLSGLLLLMVACFAPLFLSRLVQGYTYYDYSNVDYDYGDDDEHDNCSVPCLHEVKTDKAMCFRLFFKLRLKQPVKATTFLGKPSHSCSQFF